MTSCWNRNWTTWLLAIRTSSNCGIPWIARNRNGPKARASLPIPWSRSIYSNHPRTPWCWCAALRRWSTTPAFRLWRSWATRWIGPSPIKFSNRTKISSTRSKNIEKTWFIHIIALLHLRKNIKEWLHFHHLLNHYWTIVVVAVAAVVLVLVMRF